MIVLAVAKVAAVLCDGLLAGIFLGYRAGPQPALHKLDSSSFIQFQQAVHVRYVRFMPILILGALLAAIVWLVMIQPRWSTPFWLVASSVAGIMLIAAITRAVSVPLNNRLMTWSAEAPPADLRKVWEPWDRVNTIRAFLATSVLFLEAVALSL
ncbi:MAG TPA: DUF1772 domain-containing protein [Verrucomicrobiae bacterium]|nr:DUF1772 domain-containing protein [Verrucomicrobiae bacterium]